LKPEGRQAANPRAFTDSSHLKQWFLTPFDHSLSIPPDRYNTLKEIAQQKKVSLAWVVREVAEKYFEGNATLVIEGHSS